MAPAESVVNTMAASVKTPSVIVIGAGVGGLAAARYLHNANIKVVVLESRNRVGGRVHTNYSFGFPVDLGASWLHGACKDNPLSSVIGKLQLPLYKTGGDNSELFEHDLRSFALFDIDGHPVPQSLVTKVGEVFAALLDETKKLLDDDDVDISVFQAFTSCLQKHPHLRQEGLAFQVLQWYFCRMEAWFATDAENISFQSWDAQDELLQGGHGFMVEGFEPVISSLAECLDIRLNHKVASVRRNVHGVCVTMEDGMVFEADACVVALPLGVLKADVVQFEPRLPDWKEMAIADIGMGNQNKIALCFEKCFWPNVEFLGVVAPTSYGCTYFLNLHKTTGHPVLVCMPAGCRANDIELLSDEDAAKFAITELAKIIPHVMEPIQYLVSRWGTDPNSLGCYSYDAVGKPHDVYERLRKPVGNLFWAGEATSERFPGTVHGAYSTGVMAGKECLKRLAETSGHDLHMLHLPVTKDDDVILPLQITRM